jgi:hypothetical protein
MSVGTYNDLVANGLGGLLLLVPSETNLTPEVKEAIFAFEEHALTSEMEAPVYFAKETKGTK